MEQLLKLLHLTYDELMLFERAYRAQQLKSEPAVAEIINGEIECQKGMLKILVYISEMTRQQSEGSVEEADGDKQPHQPYCVEQ